MFGSVRPSIHLSGEVRNQELHAAVGSFKYGIYLTSQAKHVTVCICVLVKTCASTLGHFELQCNSS